MISGLGEILVDRYCYVIFVIMALQTYITCHFQYLLFINNGNLLL